MKYLDRFKARMAVMKQAYEGEDEMVPKRHSAMVQMGIAPERTATVSMLVDFIIGCKMKGIDPTDTFDKALGFAEMEWELAAEVVEAARAERLAAA